MKEIDIRSIVPLKSNTKCGELYFENSMFKCVCLFCENSFETITIFTNHLLEEHLYFRRITNNTKSPENEPEDNLEQNIPEISKLDISPMPIPIHTSEPEVNSPTIIKVQKTPMLIPKQVSQPKVISTQITRVQKASMHNCKRCKLSFSTRNILLVHYKKHHPELILKPPVQNICSICNKSVCSRDALKRHMGLHTGAERPHKCSYCPYSCRLKGNLTQHEKLHIGEKTEQCNYCGKKFHIRYEKNMHERRVHTKERPLQCEICGNKFFTITSLNDHKKRHTNTRNFGCSVCEKRFYNLQQLKDHMVSHTNEKPHKCDICNSKFGRRKALLQHIKIHNAVKQYNCTLCNKSFAQKPGLYCHMKYHAKQEK